MSVSTPTASAKRTPLSARKSASKPTQSSILGFFQKSSVAGSSPNSTPLPSQSGSTPSLARADVPRFNLKQSSPRSASSIVTSDPLGPPSSPLKRFGTIANGVSGTGTNIDDDDDDAVATPGRRALNGKPLTRPTVSTTPSSGRRRLAKRRVAFDDDSDDAVLETPTTPSARGAKKMRRSLAGLDDSADEDGSDFTPSSDDDDEDDDAELSAAATPTGGQSRRTRKPQARAKPTKSRRSKDLADDAADDNAAGSGHVDIDIDGADDNDGQATALKWQFDPSQPQSVVMANRKNGKSRKGPSTPAGKQKAHLTDPDQRYPWLANVRDMDKNPVGHPDYDPRTLYVPPLAWSAFSPFEKQYWEIKQKLWDTVMFFKKGKFYELYEHDATIGHQLFDLKLTDRVNMRMVGVPEATLDHWANQFVAKGYKIARVDQVESALAKEMRERGGSAKAGKEDKVIRRELAAVFTAGTLVETGMIHSDLATYCVAVKEAERDDGRPEFGVAFVDAAAGRFFISSFVDDAGRSQLETLVAQLRPTELLVEKSCISAASLRILKNNSNLTTLWNHLKPGAEFWTADTAVHEIDAAGYFAGSEWPAVLAQVRDGDPVGMSAFGALVQYLRTLMIDHELVSIGNVDRYDPLQAGSHLVLDGKSLVNLEVFANSVDGGTDGTLFQLLNQCVTPFGKRLLRQWICHPLAHSGPINARYDALDRLMAQPSVASQISACLAGMPDLERLLSRVHAGRCRGQDFVKTVEGFEQIEYTISLLSESGLCESGLLADLVAAMPDLAGLLADWKDAFDREEARSKGSLNPAAGIEPEYDESADRISTIIAAFDELKKEWQTKLKSKTVVFRDNGKEIYQLEVPITVKGVPKDWNQMSGTGKVKRYYFPALRSLVRDLQEAREMHGQLAKEVAKRMFARFDAQYAEWIAAVRVVGQLDCLLGLAAASAAISDPKCRPVFVDEERTMVDFVGLRHPCMEAGMGDFIPNDIKLGGSVPKIDLLTGANAAGKSTVLRMTCMAVILAQAGVYLPCASARMTPIDRIMSRLGANDALFAAQSTFFVELSETRKILAEATPRSLVILDELGRGTSSMDGVAVAHSVLHHLATWTGCIGVFATHYRSLAADFVFHPEIEAKRMQIDVDDAARRITFLYKLEEGVAEGSFGMHCAAMCGIPAHVIDNAERAAEKWERSTQLNDVLTADGRDGVLPLGLISDVSSLICGDEAGKPSDRGIDAICRSLERVL